MSVAHVDLLRASDVYQLLEQPFRDVDPWWLIISMWDQPGLTRWDSSDLTKRSGWCKCPCRDALNQSVVPQIWCFNAPIPQNSVAVSTRRWFNLRHWSRHRVCVSSANSVLPARAACLPCTDLGGWEFEPPTSLAEEATLNCCSSSILEEVTRHKVITQESWHLEIACGRAAVLLAKNATPHEFWLLYPHLWFCADRCWGWLHIATALQIPNTVSG